MRASGDARPAGQHTGRCDAALVRAFGILGKRWSGVILGSLAAGPAGFSELSRAIDGISDSVLSDRLATLTGAGLVVRTVSDGPPVSVTYRLSDSGAALVPVLDDLARWAATSLDPVD